MYGSVILVHTWCWENVTGDLEILKIYWQASLDSCEHWIQ